jgi:hypothetical protein
VPHIEIRPLRSDERAAWEPLWKGYQAFYKFAVGHENADGMGTT